MPRIEPSAWMIVLSSASPPVRCLRRLQDSFPLVAVGRARSLEPVRAPLLSGTSVVPTLPASVVWPSSAVTAFAADSSVRAAGSAQSAMDPSVLSSASQVIPSYSDISSKRALASPLVCDVESRRWEINLGKHPVEEVPDAAVGGNFLFFFCLPFRFSFLCNIIVFYIRDAAC